MASSPLAWGGHQPPGSEQFTGEQSHLCLLHKPSAHGTTHRCWAADSLFGQIHTGPRLAPVLQPSISLLQCLVPQGARVAVAEGLVWDGWDDGVGLSGAGWDGAYVASTTDGVGEV